MRNSGSKLTDGGREEESVNDMEKREKEDGKTKIQDDDFISRKVGRLIKEGQFPEEVSPRGNENL